MPQKKLHFRTLIHEAKRVLLQDSSCYKMAYNNQYKKCSVSFFELILFFFVSQLLQLKNLAIKRYATGHEFESCTKEIAKE